ncbi:MAG: hypothetical protein KGL39_14085 [Patescibacteria group bacterium]|nr:hypothetical protein [Patescibacteria group bacterium]
MSFEPTIKQVARKLAIQRQIVAMGHALPIGGNLTYLRTIRRVIYGQRFCALPSWERRMQTEQSY